MNTVLGYSQKNWWWILTYIDLAITHQRGFGSLLLLISLQLYFVNLLTSFKNVTFASWYDGEKKSYVVVGN